MSLQLSDPPVKTSPVHEIQTPFGREFRVTKVWEEYHRSRDQRLQSAAHTETSIALSAQTATIGATAVITAAKAGMYRVSAYLQQTTVAGVSASLQLTIRWTSGGQNFSKAGAALTSNTLTTYEALPSFMVRADAGTNITYEIAYASDPAATAAFLLVVVGEAMG